MLALILMEISLGFHSRDACCELLPDDARTQAPSKPGKPKEWDDVPYQTYERAQAQKDGLLRAVHHKQLTGHEGQYERGFHPTTPLRRGGVT